MSDRDLLRQAVLAPPLTRTEPRDRGRCGAYAADRGAYGRRGRRGHYTFRPSSQVCPLAVVLALSIRQAVAEVEGVAGQEITVVGLRPGHPAPASQRGDVGHDLETCPCIDEWRVVPAVTTLVAEEATRTAQVEGVHVLLDILRDALDDKAVGIREFMAQMLVEAHTCCQHT